MPFRGGAQLQGACHVEAVVQFGTPELEIPFAAGGASLRNGGIFIEQRALEAHAGVQRPVVDGEGFVAHFFHVGARVGGREHWHQIAIRRRGCACGRAGAHQQARIQNGLCAFEAQLHVLRVRQAPAVTGLANALTRSAVRLQILQLALGAGLHQETFAHAVSHFFIHHEQELETAAIEEAVFVVAADLPVAVIVVGLFALAAKHVGDGGRPVDAAVDDIGVAFVADQRIELHAVALEVVAQVHAGLDARLVSIAVLAHDLAEAAVGQVVVFGAGEAVVAGVRFQVEQVVQVAGLAAVGEGAARVKGVVVVVVHAEFSRDAGRVGRLLEDDVYHLPGAAHIHGARGAANDFDALDLVGGNAGELAAGGIVLAGHALAVDQQVAASSKAASAAVVVAAAAAIERDARDAGHHVIGRGRGVLLEETGGVDHGGFIAAGFLRLCGGDGDGQREGGECSSLSKGGMQQMGNDDSPICHVNSGM